MTELLTRTHAAATRMGERAAGSSVWLRGVLAALWAVSLGVAVLVVLVLVAWATDSRSGASAGAAMRAALQLWLVAHRVPLQVAGGSLAVAPLGLTLALGFLVARSAAVLARGQEVRTPSGIAVVAAAVGIPYAVLTTFVAAAATSTPVRPQPVAALLGGAVLGCLAAAWGAARGVGLAGPAWRMVPSWCREPLAAGAAAVGVVTGVAAVVMAGSVLVHVSAVTASTTSLGGGPVGVAALALLDLLLVPNALACAVAYLAGPGFAVGAGTSVTLGGAQVHRLPALPLLGALPDGGAPLVVVLVAVAALLAAGTLAGWMVAHGEGGGWRALLGRCAGAAAAAGALVAALVALAGGPAGPGAMATVGASPWQAGLAVAVEVGVVAAAAAAVLTWRRRPR